MLTLIPVARSPMILTSTEMRRVSAGEWAALYDEKVDGKTVDLTYSWRPRLGMLTEDLHGWWHSHITGDKLTKAPAEPGGRGIPCIVKDSGAPAFAASSYDFIVDAHGIPIELKHTNERNDLAAIATYYMAQFQWQMLVAGVDKMRVSIIRGNNEPEWGELARDRDCQDRLKQLADDFLWHVVNKQRPADVPKDEAVAKTVPVINGLKPYDLSASNEWVAKARDYPVKKAEAEAFKQLDKELRALIPADASVVTGGGLTAKRDTRGAYRFTVEKEAVTA